MPGPGVEMGRKFHWTRGRSQNLRAARRAARTVLPVSAVELQQTHASLPTAPAHQTMTGFTEP